MEFGKYRFRFSSRDFRERCEYAAVQLGFVPVAPLGDDELTQLVELVAHGAITSEGPLGEHIEAHRDILMGFDDDLVHWLRKIVFRGAWVDQQIKDDLVEPIFEDTGFVYHCTITGDVIEEIDDAPDWSHIGYRVETQ